MNPLYIFLLGAIGIIIAIGVGLELSKGIEEFVIYLLFWMLYIVTIATFINIILVLNYYLSMKDKTGLPGQQGPMGDLGDKGDSGLCDPACRDSICEKTIMDMLQTELKNKTRGSDTVRFNNLYIKSKVSQMCKSDEFKQLSPYNGAYNLINYIKDIWKIWFDMLYEAGGSKYFQNISAETEFEWLDNNPFFEIKKYDIFYWGMGKQYRPQLVDGCYESDNGNTHSDTNSIIFKVHKTNSYNKLGVDKGSEAKNSVSFWRAKQYTENDGNVYYPIGDIAIGPSRANDNFKTKRYVGNNQVPRLRGPNRETILVSGDVTSPINYNLIWTNDGYIDGTPFWIWRPIAPINYIALGDVVTFSSSPPPTGNNAPIRCVLYSLVIRANPNGNVLWSSYGSPTLTNILILGFNPNNGSFVGSSNSNCYNMFRAVIGLNLNNIPESDINGSFYYLDDNKYDSTNINSQLRWSNSIDTSKVGKGYKTFPKKDQKYSIMPYLNLKNNAVLTHQMTNTKINAQLIPNAISNAYLLNVGNDTNKKCLKFNGNAVTIASCDEEISSQIFSIIFTGNKSNECKLQHYDTKNFINLKNGLYTLVNSTNQNDKEYQLFIMQ